LSSDPFCPESPGERPGPAPKWLLEWLPFCADARAKIIVAVLALFYRDGSLARKGKRDRAVRLWSRGRLNRDEMARMAGVQADTITYYLRELQATGTLFRELRHGGFHFAFGDGSLLPPPTGPPGPDSAKAPLARAPERALSQSDLERRPTNEIETAETDRSHSITNDE
jgi:hypothetical protein